MDCSNGIHLANDVMSVIEPYQTVQKPPLVNGKNALKPIDCMDNPGGAMSYLVDLEVSDIDGISNQPIKQFETETSKNQIVSELHVLCKLDNWTKSIDQEMIYTDQEMIYTDQEMIYTKSQSGEGSKMNDRKIFETSLCADADVLPRSCEDQISAIDNTKDHCSNSNGFVTVENNSDMRQKVLADIPESCRFFRKFLVENIGHVEDETISATHVNALVPENITIKEQERNYLVETSDQLINRKNFKSTSLITKNVVRSNQSINEQKRISDNFKKSISVEELTGSEDSTDKILGVVNIRQILQNGGNSKYQKLSVGSETKKRKHVKDTLEETDGSYAGRPLKKNKCFHCERSYEQEKSLIRHLKTHSKNETVFKCQRCDAKFSQSSDLAKHENTHSGFKPHKCCHCNRCFSQSSALKRHMLLHSGSKPYKCTECSKSFSQCSALKRHEKCHYSCPKMFKCNVCTRPFSEKHHMLAHISNIHTHTAKSHECPICSRSYNQMGNLKVHLKTVHRKDENGEPRIKAFICKICGRGTSNSSNLNRHLRMHNKLNNKQNHYKYGCSICERRFSRNSSMRAHLRMHSNELLYKCRYCSKKFSYMARLNTHQEQHAKGVGKYQCNQCRKGFLSALSLRIHKKCSCSGNVCMGDISNFNSNVVGYERPAKCDFCLKSFALSSKLARHIRICHGDCNVFKCDVCDTGFKWRDDLLEHRKSHTNVPFQCRECEIAFQRKSHLAAHRRKHHPINAARTEHRIPTISSSISDIKGFAPSNEGGSNGCSGITCTEPGLYLTGNDSISDKIEEETRISSSAGKPNKKTKYVCRLCRLVFLSPFRLRSHIRLSHKQPMFICCQCGAGFDYRRQMSQHAKMHKRESINEAKKREKEEKMAATERMRIQEKTKMEEKLNRLKILDIPVGPWLVDQKRINPWEILLRDTVKDLCQKKGKLKTLSDDKRSKSVFKRMYYIIK